MAITRDFIRLHFGDLWPEHNHAFIALMIECRRIFDGDLEQMLILTVIGDRAIASGRMKGIDYASFTAGDRKSGQSGRINTQSIADSTGIPRETVRRKIGLLVERGWLEKHEDGNWRVTERAVTELAPATEATFDYLVVIGRALLSKVGKSSAAASEAPGAKHLDG